MELFEHPDNPVPDGASVQRIETVDRIGLRTARWMPTQSPLRGTVTLLQGRAEFIEKYFETISDLRARGFAVVAFDWRGQGESERLLRNRLRGHVDDFADFVLDLETVLDRVSLAKMPGPHFALAHSTGGLVLTLAAPRLRTRFERAVVCAPFLGLAEAGFPQGIACPLASILSAIGFGTLPVPGRAARVHMPFEDNPLTSDPVRFQRSEAVMAANDQLEIGAPTIDWLAAACRAMRQVFDPAFCAGIPLPMQFVTPGQDRLVSTRAAEHFARQTRAVRYLEIAGARHELMMEDDLYRDQFLAAFDAFVSDGTPQSGMGGDGSRG